MKRTVLLVAVLLFGAILGFAEDVPETNLRFEPAQIAFWFPEDAETAEEDGTWYAYSESTDLLLMFEDLGFYQPPEYVNEGSVYGMEETADLEDFDTYLQFYDTVAYCCVRGTHTDDEGETQDVIFGLLSSDDAPGKSFKFFIMSPDLDKPATAKALDAVFKSLCSSPAG